MSDLRKAAEMALEALEWNYGTDLCDIENCMAWLDKMNATIPALRQALAEPESTKWEPAIAHNYNPDGTLQSINVKLTPQSGWVDYEPLKREWVGLTDEERQEIVRQEVHWTGIASAIEAKLKEKNK